MIQDFVARVSGSTWCPRSKMPSAWLPPSEARPSFSAGNAEGQDVIATYIVAVNNVLLIFPLVFFVAQFRPVNKRVCNGGTLPDKGFPTRPKADLAEGISARVFCLPAMLVSSFRRMLLAGAQQSQPERAKGLKFSGCELRIAAEGFLRIGPGGHRGGCKNALARNVAVMSDTPFSFPIRKGSFPLSGGWGSGKGRLCAKRT
jgi:hypothetical protein